jgi:Ca2+-binding RTX toxin-like protein
MRTVTPLFDQPAPILVNQLDPKIAQLLPADAPEFLKTAPTNGVPDPTTAVSTAHHHLPPTPINSRPADPLDVGSAVTQEDLLETSLAAADIGFAYQISGDWTTSFNQLGPIDVRETGGRNQSVSISPLQKQIEFVGQDDVDDSLTLNLDQLPRLADGKFALDTIVYHGGERGFDTLYLEGTFDTLIYRPVGTDSGFLDCDGLTIIFTGLEPVYRIGDTQNLIIETTDAAENIVVSNATYQGLNALSVGGPFESIIFANIPNVTLQTKGGNDNVQFNYTRPAAGLTSFVVDLGAGNDGFWGNALSNTVYGGTGQDTIFGGDGDDYIFAGDDDDWIYGEGGNDTMHGGSGGDYFEDGDGNDTVIGEEGDDIVYYGGSGNDYFEGDAGNDTFYAGNDNDILDGGEGTDSLFGEAGNDIIYSSIGNDVMGGGADNDTYRFYQPTWTTVQEQTIYEVSGDGTDLLDFSNCTSQVVVALSRSDQQEVILGKLKLTLSNYSSGLAELENVTGGSGYDYLFGNSLNNVFHGGASGDFLVGGPGNDELYADTGGSTLVGEDGDDHLVGGDDVDTIWGLAGNDFLEGNGGNDALIGDAGNDTLIGGAGDDSLGGGADSDVYRFNGSGNLGSDYVNETNGTDLLDFSGLTLSTAQGVTVNLGLPGNQTIINVAGTSLILNLGSSPSVENATGTAKNDSFFGDSHVNVLHGGAGDDYFFDGDGNDWLYGEDGNDTFDYGGSGNDYFYGGAGDDTFYDDEGNDNFFGEDGADTFYMAGGTNTVSAGAGNDVFNGSGENDLLLGEDDDDTFYIYAAAPSTFQGGPGDDNYVFSQPWWTSTVQYNIVEAAGEGTDTLDFSGLTSGITVNLTSSNQTVLLNKIALTLSNGSTAIGELENVFGGSGGDTISGNDADNTLLGNNGTDIINGAGGNDTIDGGSRNDTLSGGTGNDLISGGQGNDTISGDAGRDTLNGDEGNDIINGGDGDDIIYGDEGNDTLAGNNGDDVLAGGNGIDTYPIDPADSYQGDEFIDPDGAPAITDSNNNTNYAPKLNPVEDKFVVAGTPLSFDVTAFDPDAGQTLTYSLANGSQGSISPAGHFSWTPPTTLSNQSFTIQVNVADNGTPVLRDSLSFQITVNDGTPPTPSGLQLQPGLSYWQISFAWGAISGAEYIVERRPPGGEWEVISPAHFTNNAYGDLNLLPGKRFEYRVCAVRNGKQSDFTAPIVSNTTLPKPAYAIAIDDPQSATMEVSWAYPNTVTVDGFRIERSLGNGTWTEIGTVDGSALEFSDHTTEAGTVYFYRVIAFTDYVQSISVATAGTVSFTPISTFHDVAITAYPIVGAQVNWDGTPSTAGYSWYSPQNARPTLQQVFTGLGTVGISPGSDSVELTFASGDLTNGPGPDLILRGGSFGLRTSFDNFATNYYSYGTPFLSEQFYGYVGNSGSATGSSSSVGIFIYGIDLTDLGVPLGASVDKIRFDPYGSSFFGAAVISLPLTVSASLELPKLSNGNIVVAVNDNFDEANHNASGQLIRDNEVDVHGDRITSDHQLLTGYLKLTSNEPLSYYVPSDYPGGSNGVARPLRGKWKLTFPDKIKVWRPNYTQIQSGVAYAFDETLPVNGVAEFYVPFLIEGITESNSTNDVAITAEFVPTNDAGDSVLSVYDTAHLTVTRPTLAIDSNNDGQLTSADDIAKHDVTSPGKFIPVNNRDYDLDGIPGFADGLKIQGRPKAADVDHGPRQDFPFAKLTLSLPTSVDPNTALIRFEGVDQSTFEETRLVDSAYALPVYSYLPLRLWAESAFRFTDQSFSVSRGGSSWIGGNIWIPASDLGFSDETRTLTFYVEGLHAYFSNVGAPLTVTVDPSGTGNGYEGVSPMLLTDTVTLTVIEVDADLGNGPESTVVTTAAADQQEEMTGNAPLLPQNNGDLDVDTIPDWLDGFTTLGMPEGTPPQEGTDKSARFTPLRVQLSFGIDITTAKVRFVYDYAIPGLTSVDPLDPLPGSLRIWKKDGNQARVASDDFIFGDEWISATDLGFSAQTRVKTFYVEGIDASKAGNAIRVEVDPTGGTKPMANDVVKANVGKYAIAGKIEYSLGNELPTAPVRNALITLAGQARSTYTNDHGEFVFQFTSLQEIPSGPVSMTVLSQSDPTTSADRPVARTVFVHGGEYLERSISVPTDTTRQVYVDLTQEKAIGSGGQRPTVRKAFEIYDAALSAAQVSEHLVGIQSGRADIAFTTGNANTAKDYIHLPVSDIFVNWETVMHEYGHVVANDLHFLTITPAYLHSLNINVRLDYQRFPMRTQMLAFDEGWADFYSIYTQQVGYLPSGKQLDGVDGLFYGNQPYPIKAPGFGSRTGEDEELTIARVLWNLTYPSSGPGLTINQLIADIQGAGSLLHGAQGGSPTLNILEHFVGPQFNQLFVDMGAAPKAVGTYAGFDRVNLFTVGGIAPTFIWKIPQGTVTGTYDPGSGAYNGWPSNVLDRFKLIIRNSSGATILEQLIVGPDAPFQTGDTLSVTLTNFGATHSPGQYTWQVQGWWDKFNNDGFLSQELAFQLVAP